MNKPPSTPPPADYVSRVEKACAQLAADGKPITADAVADESGLSRATLYRNPTLRAIIDEHRARQRDARTLTGLTAEVAHLRTAVEALAASVKRHEEQIRRLNRRSG